MKTRQAILALALATVAGATPGAQQRTGTTAPAPVAFTPTALVAIDGGRFRPLFPAAGGGEPIDVAPFRLEEHAVTNAQFLAFVTANQQWRRSRVARVFADARYLAHWPAELELGPDQAERPVTHVSWFAARAYARWLGRRLPTSDEWEYVAAASEIARDGRGEPEFAQRILDWYSRPGTVEPPVVRTAFENAWQVFDLHGSIWEWTSDFNSGLVTGESRADAAIERGLYCGAGAFGAADPGDYAAFMRFAFRSSLLASYTVRNLGFRCATDAEAQQHVALRPAPAELPATSLWHLPTPWTDTEGRERRLADFAGQPVVLAMIFTHCAYACPRIVADLQAIERKLAPALRGEVRFVLASMDWDRDTPAVLAAFARERGLDLSRWTLLSGREDGVRELAAALALRIQRAPNGDFAHGNQVNLIDRRGDLRVRHAGLGLGDAEVGTLVARLTELAGEGQRP